MKISIDSLELSLVPMTVDHLPEVLAIENKSNPSPWSEKHFLSSIESTHQALVLLNGDELVGYIITSTVVDEAELLNITVVPAYRKRGIAEQLIETVCNQFSDAITTFFLEVRESNQPAINLYEKVGFNELGRRKNYYPSPSGREDALILAKTFRF